ncbi:hypothetical protein EV424DRAFT_1350463 [Suillus variegatus]|nr:hypothetical protein EV424DRAFT_1350463 [Suillus variegatus]
MLPYPKRTRNGPTPTSVAGAVPFLNMTHTPTGPRSASLSTEHYFACPVKFDFRGSAPPRPSSEPDDAQSPIYDSSENVDAADGKQDEPLIQVAGSSKQRKNEAQRRQELGGRRNEKLARSGDGFCPSNTERRPTAASLFELDNPRTDGISRTANSVEDNTLRSMELSDDEGPEEENQDHIPFATLNQRFYTECRRRGDVPWKYRYATTKEIMEQTLGDIGS